VARQPGWHVETDTVYSDLKLGGRHHHVKIRDDDPSVRVTTDAVFTEYFDPDVFVARQRITGDPGIDPDVPLELRVEFTKAMLWIKEPRIVRDVDDVLEMPMGGGH
jgi:hypothetical protein